MYSVLLSLINLLLLILLTIVYFRTINSYRNTIKYQRNVIEKLSQKESSNSYIYKEYNKLIDWILKLLASNGYKMPTEIGYIEGSTRYRNMAEKVCCNRRTVIIPQIEITREERIPDECIKRKVG